MIIGKGMDERERYLLPPVPGRTVHTKGKGNKSIRAGRHEDDALNRKIRITERHRKQYSQGDKAMKRKIAMLTALFLVVAAFAGCTGSSGEDTGADDPGPKDDSKDGSDAPDHPNFFIITNGEAVYGVKGLLTEVISPENRESPDSRVKSGGDFNFYVGGLEEADAQSFDWDFGDGATASGMDVDHEYPFGGSFVVTLTVTYNDDATASRSVAVGLDYRAEGKDTVSGTGCVGYDKVDGEEYWEYAFHVKEGAKKIIVETKADEGDAPQHALDNDIALQLLSPGGEVLVKSDEGSPAADEKVELDGVGDSGEYRARAGCYDVGGDGLFYANTGEVSYTITIDVIYIMEEEE